jgi:hypothetical protein
MNNQDFKDYFQNYYEKDMKIYRELRPISKEEGLDGICRHVTHDFLQSKLYEKFHNFEYFILCNYEFNLIIQVIYSHFYLNWKTFKEILPDFIYLETGHNSLACAMTTPWSLLREFKQRPRNGEFKRFEFSMQDRLEADLFFKEYLINIFEDHPDLNMNWDKFVQAMLSDEDIQKELKRLEENR